MKRLASLITAVVMILSLSLIPVAASGVYDESVVQAWRSAIDNHGTFQLPVTPTTFTSSFVVTAGEKLTVNVTAEAQNGSFSTVGSIPLIHVQNGGQLTITGPGTFVSENTEAPVILVEGKGSRVTVKDVNFSLAQQMNTPAIRVMNEATLALDGVTVSAHSSDIASDSVPAIQVVGGRLSITDSHISTDGFRGIALSATGTSVASVRGSEFSSEYAAVHQSAGTVAFSNCKLSGTVGAITEGGSLTFEGSTEITVTESFAFDFNGTEVQPAAVYSIGDSNVLIKNGTYNTVTGTIGRTAGEIRVTGGIFLAGGAPDTSVLEYADAGCTLDESGKLVAPQTNPFVDVPENAWYASAVQDAYNRKLMSGVSENLFAPEEKTSRAMMVTVLYRLAGSPSVSMSSYTDVLPTDWFAKAVSWATTYDVVKGYGDGRFGPNDYITREQMAVMLYRFCESQRMDVSATVDISSYPDAVYVDEWAVTAVSWAVASGILTGNGVGLAPTDTSTRAEMATLLSRVDAG